GPRADRRALRAADDRAEDGTRDRAAADLRGARVARRIAVAINRLGCDWETRPIGEHERMEPDAEARAILELAAALDNGDRPERAGAGRNGDFVADAHVADDPRFDAIFKVGAIARDRAVE